MQIRKAVESDVASIHVLIRALSVPFLLSPDGTGADAFIESISEASLRRFIAAPNFDYRVAVDDEGELAGLVAMRDNKHLYHLFVAPAWQGRGLSRELWQIVQQAALDAGNPGQFTVNASLNAVPVYARFGFVATSPRVEKSGVAFVPMVLGQAPSV